MQQILIDACGWVACINASFNIDVECSRLLGSYRWLVLENVLNELENIQTQNPKPNLLLGLLKQQALIVATSDNRHTDDILIEYAHQHNTYVLTVDVELKRRLFELNIPLLEVHQSKKLVLIDSL